MKALALCLFLATAGSAFDLDQAIANSGFICSEGHIGGDPKQGNYLHDLIQKNGNIRNVAETGFNAGHSSELFLSARENTTVVSFDLLSHEYSRAGKDYIDMHYPNRHQLIGGDSIITVPQYHRHHPYMTFDLIYVDGGHTYSTCGSDIINMRYMAHADTLLIVDNLEIDEVQRAWKKCIEKGLIQKIEQINTGRFTFGVARYNPTWILPR